MNILGVPVSPWDVDSLVDEMITSAAEAGSLGGHSLRTVHYANIHVLNAAYRNTELRLQLAAASTVYCDGSGVRLGALLLGQSLPRRLTAADWFDVFCERAAFSRLRLFIVAGAEGVADQASHVIRLRHPGLKIVGTHHGYIDELESRRVVAEANALRADVVIVGMGTPTQELWVARHRHAIEAPVVWTVGALFDFVAQVQRRAPSWLRRLHLEWLWRVGTDPRRLAGRYLIGNPLFLLRVARQRALR